MNGGAPLAAGGTARTALCVAILTTAAVSGCASNNTASHTPSAAPTAAPASVNDKGDIRCYFHADLTTTHKLKPPQEGTLPPYMTAGIIDTDGADATKDPNTGRMVAGMKQISDPVNLCSGIWSEGRMNSDGITDDLIPADFLSPGPGSRAPGHKFQDQNGNPLATSSQVTGSFGHYIPHLTECVVDNAVAVIPGGPETCAGLGVPALQK